MRWFVVILAEQGLLRATEYLAYERKPLCLDPVMPERAKPKSNPAAIQKHVKHRRCAHAISGVYQDGADGVAISKEMSDIASIKTLVSISR